MNLRLFVTPWTDDAAFVSSLDYFTETDLICLAGWSLWCRTMHCMIHSFISVASADTSHNHSIPFVGSRRSSAGGYCCERRVYYSGLNVER